MRIRNWCFDSNIFEHYDHSKATIGVGNLRLGGTGKTPMIEYLAQLLGSDYRTVVLSRGYGRKTKGYLLASDKEIASTIGDEPAQIHGKFKNIAVAVSESRKIGLQNLLVDLPEHQVVLLDDVMQHRAVNPGLKIMLTTFSNPFFEDFVLPAGRLREARSGAKRADIIVVTKCPAHLSASQMHTFEMLINPKADQTVFFSTELYKNIAHIQDSEKKPLDFLNGKNVILLTGLASAKSIVEFVKSRSNLLNHFEFADHHAFTEKELLSVINFVNAKNDEKTLVLTTEKDAQRLRMLADFEKFAALPVYVLPLSIEFLGDSEQAFKNRIVDYVKSNS